MQNAGLDEAQTGIKTAWRYINKSLFVLLFLRIAQFHRFYSRLVKDMDSATAYAFVEIERTERLSLLVEIGNVEIEDCA